MELNVLLQFTHSKPQNMSLNMIAISKASNTHSFSNQLLFKGRLYLFFKYLLRHFTGRGLKDC